MRPQSRGHRFARMFLICNVAAAGMMSAAATIACPTLDEAAQDALRSAMPLSTQYEYGGALYVLDGCHGYTAPQTSNSETSVELRVSLPPGAHLAGLYHTHPGSEEQGRMFSPHDVTVQRDLHVPSYIGFVATSEVFVLRETPRRDNRTARVRAVMGKPL